MLRERGEVASSMHPRSDAAVRDLHGGEPPLAVDLLMLARAFRQVLEEKRLRTPHVYEPSRYTVRDRINYLMRTLSTAGHPLAFTAIFEEGTVEEAVVTFLALLELAKRGALRIRQDASRGEISLELVPEELRPVEFDATASSEFDLEDPSRLPLDEGISGDDADISEED